MSLTKTIEICRHMSFKHWLLHHSVRSLKWFLHFRYCTETLYSLLHFYMHSTWYVLYFPLYDYVNNTRWTVTDTKLTTESSASPYSYLHPSPNILLIILLSQNPQSVVFSWHKTPNFTPTRNDRNNVSFVYQYMKHSELNGSKFSPNYPVLFWWQFKIF
jgi:hypothetical protein